MSQVKADASCGVFAALVDHSLFEQAYLELGVVTWTNGADLDPLWMYEQLQTQKTWSVPF